MTATDELVDRAVGTQPEGEEISARRFTYWFLQRERGHQADWIRAVWPSLDDLLGEQPIPMPTDEVVALRRELEAACNRRRFGVGVTASVMTAFDEACMRVGARS